MRRSRSIARVMAVGWVLAGGFVDPLGAEWAIGHDVSEDRLDGAGHTLLALDGEASPASSTVSGGCPATISCGAGCVAQLGSGWCSGTLSWEGGVSIGPFQLGPELKVECKVCDCMYLQPGPAGTILNRQVDFGCSVTAPGLEVY